MKITDNEIKRKSIRPLLAVLAILLLMSIVGIFGVAKYYNSQANRIYSVGQSMKFPGFSVTVENSQLKPVDLPLNKDVIAKYGGVSTNENCEALSKAPSPQTGYQSILPTAKLVENPSPYNFCIRRNDSRKNVGTYISQNRQITIKFTIKAESTVNIQVLPDSGRNPNPNDKLFNGNELLFDNMSNDFNGYYSSFEAYSPYGHNDLGGNVNNGLSRNGFIYTDVRNTENSVDFSFSYNQSGSTVTKITRVLLVR
jgi:hypothetical protein